MVRELGQGGMGVVYQAVRTADGALVALKTIKPAVEPTPVEIDRFLREARILSELDHPNIVSFHELGESNGLLYFAMDYVAGHGRRRFAQIEYGGPLPIGRARSILSARCSRAARLCPRQGFRSPRRQAVQHDGDTGRRPRR